jgi:hypothetical protein
MQHLELQNRLERKDAEVNQLNQRISIFELHFAQKMQLRAPQNMQVPLPLSGQLLGQTNGAPMVGPVQAGSMVQMQKSNNAAVPQAIPRAIGSNTKVNTLLELERMGIHQKKADPEKTVEATVVCISAADGGSLHRTIASPTDGNIISVDNNPQKKGYQKVVSGTIPLSISVASGTIPLPVGSKHHFFLSHCQVGVHRIPHCYPLNRNDFSYVPTVHRCCRRQVATRPTQSTLSCGTWASRAGTTTGECSPNRILDPGSQAHSLAPPPSPPSPSARATDLTKDGMRQGIADSATFFLFLSDTVLERPFCECHPLPPPPPPSDPPPPPQKKTPVSTPPLFYSHAASPLFSSRRPI